MSSFRTSFTPSSSQNSQSFLSNRFSMSKKTKCVDLTDSTLFPSLDGTIVEPSNTVQQDSLDNSPTSLTEECEYSAPVRPWYIPDKEDTDTDTDALQSGWILMTADDARKPMPKPVHEPESEDDEDTMPMTTSKKPPKPKPIPNVELTSAQIIELFRLDVARHDRDVAAQENDDIYDECIDEDALAWDRESESYFSWGDEYLDEEDDEEYYEYE